MLRTCVKLAQEQQRVVVFLEPIALYMTRDLHEKGDDLWAFDYVEPSKNNEIALSEVASFGEGKDLCIVSYGNGYYLSRQAEQKLKAHGIDCKVIDLRWLAPLNHDEILTAVSGFDKVLIVDECRQTASISEAIVTMLTEHAQNSNQVVPHLHRITADDSFIPLGAAANHVLPSCQEIVDAGLALVAGVTTISPFKRS
jgi:2-oxoisovalerate dehydrogenase E1 component